jgi:hypothetical protein
MREAAQGTLLRSVRIPFRHLAGCEDRIRTCNRAFSLVYSLSSLMFSFTLSPIVPGPACLRA